LNLDTFAFLGKGKFKSYEKLNNNVNSFLFDKKSIEFEEEVFRIMKSFIKIKGETKLQCGMPYYGEIVGDKAYGKGLSRNFEDNVDNHGTFRKSRKEGFSVFVSHASIKECYSVKDVCMYTLTQTKNDHLFQKTISASKKLFIEFVNEDHNELVPLIQLLFTLSENLNEEIHSDCFEWSFTYTPFGMYLGKIAHNGHFHGPGIFKYNNLNNELIYFGYFFAGMKHGPGIFFDFKRKIYFTVDMRLDFINGSTHKFEDLTNFELFKKEFANFKSIKLEEYKYLFLPNPTEMNEIEMREYMKGFFVSDQLNELKNIFDKVGGLKEEILELFKNKKLNNSNNFYLYSKYDLASKMINANEEYGSTQSSSSQRNKDNNGMINI
jgi:hypothetical protein